MATAMSMRKFAAKGTSMIMEDRPTTNRMLKMLEPTMLPMAMSALPFRAAVTEVNSSGREEVCEADVVQPLWKNLAMTGVGLVLIVWGSNVTVDAATALARIFGMSERFIGLTIVALGTSLPELFTSVNAAWKGNADIAIGNIVGSNIFNILFVVGISGLITPVPFADLFVIDTLVAMAAAAVLGGFCVRKGKLVTWHGVVMLMAYGAYLGWLLMK